MIDDLDVFRTWLLSDSLNFTRFFFKEISGGTRFVVGPHHRMICDALNDVLKGRIKYLIINIAPRYSKTEIAVKNFISMGLAINQAAKFIHLSYSGDLALDNSICVKDVVESEAYQRFFPMQVGVNRDTKARWDTGAGGGLYATSTLGQITGFGAGAVDIPGQPYRFAGAIIIDDPSKPFSFDDYPLTREAVKRLQSQFNSDVYAVIMAGTSEEWKESNLVQNLVANKVLTAYIGTDRNGEEYTRYYQTNPDALKSFQERKNDGMNLSTRVWDLSEQYKTELEESITAALAPGTSAIELASEVKQYLKEPTKRFRRIKEKMEDGTIKWNLSKNAKAFHPGQGVYRSSARNAQRLARTEINMAYRTAEQKRWDQFDFVVGYEVKTTQNGHHIADICDQLAGKYPKDFKFTGWHPQCMCYCIPILKTEDEFWAYDPENPQKSANEITELPSNFREWINDNRERIEAAEKRGKLPYFIRDNREDVENILNPKERGKTPLEIAAERHAARTPEDVERIQSKWNEKLMHDLLNQSDRIGSYHDKEFRELAKLLEDDNALMDFDAFKLNYQLAKKYLRDKIDADTALVGEFLKNKANVENMKELAKALGVEYKDPMTFFEANELRGNPNYKSDSIYRVNCQTCVVAHELRRRGFDVQALGNTKGSWSEKLSMGTNRIWLDENGKIPEKQIIGAEFNLFNSIDPSGKVHKKGWQKTAANRKQLITQLESAITEDGRYHIDWTWNGQGSTLKGHIICVERIDGVIRYYDPQNGKVIPDFYSYINDIKLNHGINLLRVDNLRIDPNYAGHILSKAGSSATSGKGATSGITGFSLKDDKDGFKALQKEIKQSAEGYSKTILYDRDILYTHRMVINRDSLKDLIGHAYTSDELEAIKKLPNHLSSLSSPQYDPLKISRPNIRKKIDSGVVHFVEYEIEIDGKQYILKTKACKDQHGSYLVEHPYFFREKNKKKTPDLPLTRNSLQWDRHQGS